MGLFLSARATFKKTFPIHSSIPILFQKIVFKSFEIIINFLYNNTVYTYIHTWIYQFYILYDVHQYEFRYYINRYIKSFLFEIIDDMPRYRYESYRKYFEYFSR